MARALMAGCRVLNLAREESETLIIAQEISFLLSSGEGTGKLLFSWLLRVWSIHPVHPFLIKCVRAQVGRDYVCSGAQIGWVGMGGNPCPICDI